MNISYLDADKQSNSQFLLLRFGSALHCGYSGITDKDNGLE